MPTLAPVTVVDETVHLVNVLLVIVTVNPLEALADSDCEELLASDDGWVKVIVCDAFVMSILRMTSVAAS